MPPGLHRAGWRLQTIPWILEPTKYEIQRPPQLAALSFQANRAMSAIEKFSNRPVKLLFLTPEAKAAILDKPENPFKWAYVIDGEVSTVEGEPALYKIAAVHEAIERS